MNTLLVKKGQDRREAIRATTLARRMVGMYRLMAEQSSSERLNQIKNYNLDKELSNSVWRRFKEEVFRTLKADLLCDSKMKAMLDKATKENGSLKELLWDYEQRGLPKQSLVIRIGKIMEKAISTFLSSEYEPYNKVLDQSVLDIADYNIQRDVSVKKDNTIIVAEIKYNLNLDTEKAKAVVDKLDLLNISYKNHLKDKDLKVNVCMVSLRYPTVDDIPSIKPSLEGIRAQYIIGYQQFFNFFGIRVTETMWKNLHKRMSEEVDIYFENYIARN